MRLHELLPYVEVDAGTRAQCAPILDENTESSMCGASSFFHDSSASDSCLTTRTVAPALGSLEWTRFGPRREQTTRTAARSREPCLLTHHARCSEPLVSATNKLCTAISRALPPRRKWVARCGTHKPNGPRSAVAPHSRELNLT